MIHRPRIYSQAKWKDTYYILSFTLMWKKTWFTRHNVFPNLHAVIFPVKHKGKVKSSQFLKQWQVIVTMSVQLQKGPQNLPYAKLHNTADFLVWNFTYKTFEHVFNNVCPQRAIHLMLYFIQNQLLSTLSPGSIRLLISKHLFLLKSLYITSRLLSATSEPHWRLRQSRSYRQQTSVSNESPLYSAFIGEI